MPTGAQIVVSELERAGVEVVFGLPGVHNLPLWEALRHSPIRLVGVRHEQAAAYAADGYARATGRLGVALTTTGPGAANTLGAVGEAWASRSSVLVIATDIPTTLRRPGVYRGVLHETRDQAAMFAPVVDSVHVCGDVGETVYEAIASVHEAPVYLEIPTDLLNAPATASTEPFPEEAIPAIGMQVPPSERPLLWVGGGAVDSRDRVVALAETLRAPVIETYQGRGVMPVDHPLRVGMPPHMPSVGALWDEADLVIAIGDELDGMVTQNFLQPQPPTLISAGRPTANYDASDIYDVRNLIAEQREDQEVEQRVRRVRAETCAELDGRAERFLDALAFALPEDANVVCDMCIPGYWTAGFHPFPAPRRLQYPMGWGTLGFAFPAALGAALAHTGPTVSISGDGGFLFACGELATVAQEQLPLTAVIVDDGGYGMLRYDQDLAGSERFGVDLKTPDFAALAESFGIRAQRVDGLEEDFGVALSEHVADPAPSVLVATAEALVPPPTTSPNWYRKRHSR
jgi:acetolactate synthase-1/2/3 large subunit